MGRDDLRYTISESDVSKISDMLLQSHSGNDGVLTLWCFCVLDYSKVVGGRDATVVPKSSMLKKDPNGTQS